MPHALALALGAAAFTVTPHAGASPVLSLEESDASTRVAERRAGDHVIDRYTVALTDPPDADVVVTFVVDGQVVVYPRQLSFCRPSQTCENNWWEPQEVTVSAVDDEIPEGNPHEGSVIHHVASADPRYNAPNVATLIVKIDDDDLAGVRVRESGDETRVAEGGPSDSYVLELTTRPTAEVVVTVRAATPDGERPGPIGSSQVRVTPEHVVFEPESWREPRTITVEAIEDAKTDGDVSETLIHVVSSTDTAYNQLSLDRIDHVQVKAQDNDIASLVAAESAGATRVIEGGAVDGYTISPTSEPESSVSVTIVPRDPDQLTVTPPRITFTPFNYRTPQTITVTAVDDTFAEGARNFIVDHIVSTSGLDYQGKKLAPIAVRIVDNDVPAVLVQESGDTRIAEGGSPDDYTLVLTTAPDDAVTVQVLTGGQVVADPPRLTFTPGNHDQPQTVTLTAIDDQVVEGEVHETVTHVITDAERSGYKSVAVEPLVAIVADNDAATPVRGGGGGIDGRMLAGLLLAMAGGVRRFRRTAREAA